MKDIKEIALDKWGFKLAFMKPFLVIIKDDVEKGDRVVFTHVDAGGNKFETNVVNIKSAKYGRYNAVDFEPEIGNELTQRLIYNEDIIMDFESPNPIATIDRTDYEIIKGSDFTNGIIRGGFASADLLEIDTVYDLCYTDHMGYRHYIHDVLVTSCDPSNYDEGVYFPMFEINREAVDEDEDEGEKMNKVLNVDWDDFKNGARIVYVDEFVTSGVYDLVVENPQGEMFVKKNVEVEDCWEALLKGKEGKWACEFRIPITNVDACVYKPEGDVEDDDACDTVSERMQQIGEGFGEAFDKVGDDPTNPNYYKQASIELIDFMEETSSPEAFQGYCKNNVLKYVVRYKNKNGVEDLNKAMWYLQRLIESETK